MAASQSWICCVHRTTQQSTSTSRGQHHWPTRRYVKLVVVSIVYCNGQNMLKLWYFLQAWGCIIGKDYPSPIVDHTPQSKANMVCPPRQPDILNITVSRPLEQVKNRSLLPVVSLWRDLVVSRGEWRRHTAMPAQQEMWRLSWKSQRRKSRKQQFRESYVQPLSFYCIMVIACDWYGYPLFSVVYAGIHVYEILAITPPQGTQMGQAGIKPIYYRDSLIYYYLYLIIVTTMNVFDSALQFCTTIICTLIGTYQSVLVSPAFCKTSRKASSSL